jgi:hypothetical protein
MSEMICFDYSNGAIMGVLLLLEFWLGKTQVVKANSSLELIQNLIKTAIKMMAKTKGK